MNYDPAAPGVQIDTSVGLSTEEKNWAMLCHLSSLSGYFGVPLGHIIGPFLVWIIKRDSSEFVNFHGKESINFHLSVTLYGIGAGALLFFAMFVPAIGLATTKPTPNGPFPAQYFLPVIFAGCIAAFVWLFATICTVIATLRAGNGEKYIYPLSIQFVR